MSDEELFEDLAKDLPAWPEPEWPPQGTHTCPFCGGKGTIPSAFVIICKGCKGRGWVDFDESDGS